MPILGVLSSEQIFRYNDGPLVHGRFPAVQHGHFVVLGAKLMLEREILQVRAENALEPRLLLLCNVLRCDALFVELHVLAVLRIVHHGAGRRVAQNLRRTIHRNRAIRAG